MDESSQPVDVLFAERIAALEDALVRVNTRLDDGEIVMDGIKTDLKKNTESTLRIETNTGDIVEAFSAMKGAFKVFNWIGKLAKPMGAIIGLGIAIYSGWQIFRTGVPPK